MVLETWPKSFRRPDPEARSPDRIRTSPQGVIDRMVDVAAVTILSYIILLLRFEWDPRKAASNLKKHGVAFDEARTAFDDKLAAYYPDALNPDRFVLIGFSRLQRLLYVVHAEVGSDAIRIISARKATRHEKTHYEND
jgi:uncharacterized DUF497 family protein